MANILNKIIDQTHADLINRKQSTSLSALRSMPFYDRKPYSLKNALLHGSGIIAEHKRQSPSKGSFNCPATLIDVVTGYEKAGASAISCLTDSPFFGGALDDLMQARAAVTIPLLRKDFMIDLYQVHESKAYGADAILLIAACLNDEELKTLSLEAVNIGLSILFEVHDLEELNRIKTIATSLPQDSFVIGVNNRNLTTFVTDVDNSLQLLPHFPNDSLAISESGISDPETVIKLRKAGFQGFLIGENFMKTDQPGVACNEFIKNTNYAN
jgi:indole-3-glycerol phosphate synthase